jgi:hypothetical protein
MKNQMKVSSLLDVGVDDNVERQITEEVKILNIKESNMSDASQVEGASDGCVHNPWVSSPRAAVYAISEHYAGMKSLVSSIWGVAEEQRAVVHCYRHIIGSDDIAFSTVGAILGERVGGIINAICESAAECRDRRGDSLKSFHEAIKAYQLYAKFISNRFPKGAFVAVEWRHTRKMLEDRTRSLWVSMDHMRTLLTGLDNGSSESAEIVESLETWVKDVSDHCVAHMIKADTTMPDPLRISLRSRAQKYYTENLAKGQHMRSAARNAMMRCMSSAA